MGRLYDSCVFRKWKGQDHSRIWFGAAGEWSWSSGLLSVSFSKGQRYGEVLALEGHPIIDVEQFGTEVCITRENVSQEDYDRAKTGLDRCAAAVDGRQYHLVVLDEVYVALAFGLLNEGDVVALMHRVPDDLELVLTGRYARERLMEIADLVTDMGEVKHYYSKGIGVRKGIEN